jgi:signal-transduction protein with cAMP-binding, CBS, and nucleotidyltransferase domain
MKGRLEHILIHPQATILDAVRAIDLGAVGVALVVDNDRRLLATVTDGDIRRGLLRGLPLTSRVSEVMRLDPAAVRQEEGQEAALRLMRRLTIHQVPIVDAAGRVVGLEWADRLVGIEAQETPVVLMAGGLGVRLRPPDGTDPEAYAACGRTPASRNHHPEFR